MIRSIKKNSKRTAKKIKKFTRNMSGSQQSRIINSLCKNIMLYHWAPPLLSEEITGEDMKEIVNTVERSIRVIPGWVSINLINNMNSSECTISWMMRVINKMMQKLCTVETIKMEMGLYLPLKEAKERFTNWFIWRDGVYMDWDEIMKLTKPECLRLIAQINRNIFYDIDYNKNYIHICKWGVKWDENHRLYWENVWVKKFKIFISILPWEVLLNQRIRNP